MADLAAAQLPGRGGNLGEETRQRLLDAALEVFNERGYEGTRVQEIAKRAGFTTGAIYANFPSKGSLLAEAISESAVRRLATTIFPLVAGLEPAEAVRALAQRTLTIESAPNDRALLHALAAASHDPEVATQIRPRIEVMLGGLRRLLGRAQESGAIDPDVDFDAFVRVAAAIMFGAIVVRTLDLPPVDQQGVDDVIERLLAAMAPTDSPG